MEFVPPPEFNIQPRGPPLWVKSAEWGFSGFKPTIWALCYLKAHDILQHPEREYFSRFVQEHINMRNNSKRNWNNPYSEFYTPSLQKHLEHYFGQFNVSQELPAEDKLSKLLELSELYIEITNQGFLIQALNCGTSYDDREVGVGTEEPSACNSRPGERAAHADPIIPPKPSPTHVYVPPKPFPHSLIISDPQVFHISAPNFDR